MWYSPKGCAVEGVSTWGVSTWGCILVSSCTGTGMSTLPTLHITKNSIGHDKCRFVVNVHKLRTNLANKLNID